MKRIFNQEKTEELISPDLTLGRLAEDKLVICHHEAVEAVEEVSHYETIKEYANGGKDVQKVIDVPAVKAREAYDDYEDILVYIPYTEEELQERKLMALRLRRATLLTALDKYKNNVMYGIEAESEETHAAMLAWRQSLLDLDESAFEDIPERVQYYL